MLTFRAGLLGFVVALNTAVTAPCAWADDSTCEGFGTLEPNKPLSLGTVTSASPRVNFVKGALDQKGCPSTAPECRDRAYLVPGDQVIVSQAQGDLACASYVNPKGLVRAGWLPRTALANAPDQTGTRLEDWVGRWRAPEQSLVIREATAAGTLKIQGEATFGALSPDWVNRGAVNTGSIEAVAKPEGSSLAFTMGPNATLPYDQGGETDCRVRLRLLGPFLLAEDNGSCGGLNVSFSGAYRKSTASKAKALAPGLDPAAQTFVESIYKPYERSANALGLSDAKTWRLFTPATAALILKDRRDALAQGGGYGQLDVDPFINGQDWAPTKINLKVTDDPQPDRAHATATYTVPEGPGRKVVIGLDLLKTPVGWRVSDIKWQDETKSLRQLLAQGGQ
jgi:hypothetical protein